MTIRAALISYPMIFQQTGGLQIQIRETLAALRALGVDARLFDTLNERVTDYDVVHVFAAVNGNHRIVEKARSNGIPVVISPVLHPPWTRWDRFVARAAGTVAGRLTGWRITTTFEQLRSALAWSDRIIALGAAEHALIERAFGIPAGKIRTIPNGIKPEFFHADGALFRERFGIEGDYALIVAYVAPYKGQLEAARALGQAMPLVMIGPCHDKPYLDRIQSEAGDHCRYLGEIANTDPVLPSAYAGARVFVLPSKSEVYPISAIEALAAGTPVLLTRENSLELDDPNGCIVEVDPTDAESTKAALSSLLQDPPPGDDCQAVVRHLTWKQVAADVLTSYEELLRSK